LFVVNIARLTEVDAKTPEADGMVTVQHQNFQKPSASDVIVSVDDVGIDSIGTRPIT